MKQRIEYLDIAKGIAFLLVIFCHAVAFSDMVGANSTELHYIRENSAWYQYFYMPVFFVVSGFFVNTQKPWMTFLWQNVKMLILGVIGIKFLQALISNTLTLHPQGIIDFFHDMFLLDNILRFWGLWFIGAIFTARMIYFVLAKIANNEKVLAILLLIVAIGGGILERFSVPNILWFQQGMVLSLFVLIGSILKKIDLSTKQYLILGGIYVISFVILQPLGLNNSDSYCSMSHTPDIYHLPLSIYMGTLGTCLVLGISKVIGKSVALSFIGINSTVWYIVNGCTNYGIRVARKLISLDSYFDVAIYLSIIIMVVLVYSTLFTLVINLKYVRILKGDTQDIVEIMKNKKQKNNEYRA